MPPEIRQITSRIGWVSANITAVSKSSDSAASSTPTNELEGEMATFLKSQLLPKTNRSLCSSNSNNLSQSSENIPTSLSRESQSLLACVLNNETYSNRPSSPSLPRLNTTSNSEMLLPHDLYQKLEFCSQKTISLKQEQPVILLDCRSFTAFNKNHIEGAVNVNCSNRFSCRRLREGKLSILDLVTSEEGKEIFKQRTEGDTEVIVYDENSQELEQLPPTHPTSLVLNSLKREGTNAKLLKGGIQAFGQRYSEKCNTVTKPLPGSSFTPCNALTKLTMHTPVTSQDSPGVENRPPPMEEDSLHAPMAKILPHMYIGGEKDAADAAILRQHGITHILNATNKIPCFHESEKCLTYLRIPVKDNGTENLQKHFEKAFLFIEEAKRSGGRVLIHCQAGISRSSTLAIAYIMKYLNLTMNQSYNHVQKCRPIIAPNLSFMGQLVKYEKILNATPKKFSIIQSFKECPSPCGLQAQNSRPGTPILDLEGSMMEA